MAHLRDAVAWELQRDSPGAHIKSIPALHRAPSFNAHPVDKSEARCTCCSRYVFLRPKPWSDTERDSRARRTSPHRVMFHAGE